MEPQIRFDGNATSTSAAVNCTEQNASLISTNGCSSHSWGTVYHDQNNGSCVPEAYTGIVCRQQLLTWQECVSGRSGEVLLDSTFKEKSHDELERDVSQFLHFLRKYYIQV